MSKLPAHHEAKVQDALNVLRSKGAAHYAPDIAKFTGLSVGAVRRVLDVWEARAKSNPTGKRTIPWTRMAGNKGGIAITNNDRRLAKSQRARGIYAQAVRQAERCEAEFRRAPADRDWAISWGTAARQVDVVAFADARKVVDDLHLRALLDAIAPAPTIDEQLDAMKVHLELMAEIDAL